MSEPAFLPSPTVQPAMQVFPLPATADAPADPTAFSGLLKALETLSGSAAAAQPAGLPSDGASPDGGASPDATLFAAFSLLAANSEAAADGPVEPTDGTDAPANDAAALLDPGVTGIADPTPAGPPAPAVPAPALPDAADDAMAAAAGSPVAQAAPAPEAASPLSRAAEAFAAALLGALKEKTTAPDPEPEPARDLKGDEADDGETAGTPPSSATTPPLPGPAIADGLAPTGTTGTPTVGAAPLIPPAVGTPMAVATIVDGSMSDGPEGVGAASVTAAGPAGPTSIPSPPPTTGEVPVPTSVTPTNGPAVAVEAKPVTGAAAATAGAAAELAETLARLAQETGTAISVTVTAAPAQEAEAPSPVTPLPPAAPLVTEDGAEVAVLAPEPAMIAQPEAASEPAEPATLAPRAPVPPTVAVEGPPAQATAPTTASPAPTTPVQAPPVAALPVVAADPAASTEPAMDAMAVDASAPAEPTTSEPTTETAGEEIATATDAASDGGDGGSGSAGDDQPGGQPPPEARAKPDADRPPADALSDTRPTDPAGAQRQPSPLAAAALAFAARLRADGTAADRSPEAQPAVAVLGAAQTYGGTASTVPVMPFLAGHPAAAVPLQRLGMEIAKQAGAGETSFQIRLDPAELGRVDVRLEIGEGGETRAHLTVERRDTLELLARDQRTLERALRDAGFDSRDGSVSLSLRQNGGGEGQARQGRDESAGSGQDQGGRARGSDDSDDRTARPAIDPYRPRRDARLDVRI